MRSLRGRLTLGVVLVLAVVLAAFGVLASRSVERSQRAAVDERLQRTAELSRATARTALEQGLPTGDRRLDAVLRASGSSLRLLLDEAVLLEAGRPPATRPPTALGLRTHRARDVRHRVLTTTLEDPSLGGLALLQVTTTLEPTEARLRELDRRLVLSGLAALLVAAAGVWLAAGRVLQPLGRVRQAVAAIASEDDLDRRVPAEGTVEVRSLAESFNAMLARLGRSAADRERAFAATSRFAADAGHELRTPLTSVLTTLSTLRRHPDAPVALREGLLDDALAEHRRLVELLDGLQALARGDAALPDRDEVDLAELAEVALGAARRRHPATTFEAELPGGALPVRGWEPGLRLVLDNLLENAVRHGRADGRVRLEVRAAGAGAEVVVDDDGPGVPEAERERVLEPFARVAGTQAPGSGLGLALVAQQARHHGGAVHVEDAPLGGARMRVRLGAS
jgi:two-component system, OmpR family, sensor histidine kinase PrrB